MSKTESEESNLIQARRRRVTGLLFMQIIHEIMYYIYLLTGRPNT